MRLAAEGRRFIVAAVVVLGITAVVAWLAGLGWWLLLPAGWAPVVAWTIWFFRDPDRSGPRGENLVLAPADGRVVAVAAVDEPTFVCGPAHKISIFMNVFDVHVNRCPSNGEVAYREYRPGKFVNATLDKASEDNEQMSLGIRSARGPLLVRQIAGLVARRIVTDPSVGDTVRQGDRLGIIRFGSRLDTFVPQSAAVTVRLGDKALAGITVIAEWPS
ncbi:MAG: phosphatidylserine decarboxylase family protein [Gemmatimonadota bacterium]|nr:MAG: phosphatidylserine decarboxylase family protein [Gemmatimonadota bacterium]